MKILVGVPLAFDDKLNEEFERKVHALGENIEIYVVQDTKEESIKGDKIYRIMLAREKIREYFLSKDFSHLMFIDADISFPEDILSKFLSYDADFIYHGYNARFGDKIVLAGFGCALIRRNVVEQISFIDENICDKVNMVQKMSYF